MTIYEEQAKAMENNDISAFFQLSIKFPELLAGKDGAYMLNSAAFDGKLDFVKSILALGVDINGWKIYDPQDEGPVVTASYSGNKELVEFLVRKGAILNIIHYGEVRCSALLIAIENGDLELVNLLVEHGADVNATSGLATPLGAALATNNAEIVEYLRSVGAVVEGKAPPYNFASAHEAILSHMAKHRAPPITIDFPEFEHRRSIKLYACPPTPQWNGTAIFTVGAGDIHLMLESVGFRTFNEYMIVLPPNWPIDAAALTDPKTAWPIEWLLRVAELAERSGKWPSESHYEKVLIASNENKPLGPGTAMSSMLCLPEQGEFGKFPVPDGRYISLYSLFPIYEEERILENREGTVALIERFELLGIDRTVNPSRKNVAK